MPLREACVRRWAGCGILRAMFSTERANFLEKVDRLALWVSGLTAFAVYLLSLGPSIGMEDAGELATAADVLGVPHPPGYPLWTMLSWLFCRAFGWVTWQGWPNPGWAVALASAVAGAAAVGVLAAVISRSLKGALGGLEGGTMVRGIAGIGAALAFAFSPGMWSQSVIVEVYALGALFVSLVMLLALDWLVRRRSRTLVWLGLVFGLGLTNYQVLLLAAVPLGAMVAIRRWRLARSFLAAAVPLGLTIYLLHLGAMESADALSTPGAPVILRPEAAVEVRYPGALAPVWLYGALAGTLLAMAAVAWVRPRGRWRELGILAGLLGALLALSAWRFAARELPADFGGTLYGFGWAWAVHAVALGGLWALCWRWWRARRFAFVVSVGQVGALALMAQGLMMGLTHPTTGWFWWPIAWNGVVLALAWRLLPGGKWVAGTIGAAEAGLAVYGYMPLVSDTLNPGMNWGYARTWEGFKHAVSRGQYEAISPASICSMAYLRQLWVYLGDLRLQFMGLGMALGAAGLAGALGLAGRRAQPERGMRLWPWVTVGLFVMMSAVLVALANPTGDIQDGFIQKVKFITSHQLFALWIGYGLALAAVGLAKWRGARVAAIGVGVLAAAVALGPMVENFRDRELVRRVGAAEQTGHDFGWQFGAYMMGGAGQILAEVGADEEPLPDPFWPPPMSPGAVYFGGTDAGRFVPTYLAYAVGFRPDICVLTQNALADPTYMNVERDLYGEQLWLPTADEVRTAFTDYTDAVLAGQRTSRGKITEVNGRVQISGSAAVMEICEELARQIWERNPERDFYLEESYRMPWMDAVLEPAGLAMRLRREAEGRDLAIDRARNDDFWDWMVRRLITRAGYGRDFAAQKSFSKLRSSQAGIYARNGQAEAAERAFGEAMALFPISPDALFRYLQESLLPQARFAVAGRMLRQYLRVDSGNTRAYAALTRVEELGKADATFRALTQKVRDKAATTADICNLARTAEALDRHEIAAAYWEQVVAAADLTAGDARDGCIALQRLRKSEPAMELLRRVPETVWPTLSGAELVASSGLAQTFGERQLALGLLQCAVKAEPQSGRVWLGIALFYYGTGEEARAYECMRTAVRFGASSLIEADEAVANVFLYLVRRYGPQKGAAQ